MRTRDLSRRTTGRALAAGLALALALPAGLTAKPAMAGPASADPPAGDPAAMEEARQLYVEGKAKFDTFDYEGAIDLWTKAYAKIPEEQSSVRADMVYNIAMAQEKAYEVDKDVQHLRQAQMLLRSYVKNYKSIYKRTPETEAEVELAEDRIAALEARIAKAEAGEDETADAPGEATTNSTYLNQVDGITWNSGSHPPPDPQLLERNKKLEEEGKKTDAMLISGYVVGSLGLLFLLGAASAFGVGAAADDADAQDTRRAGRTGGFVMLGLGLGAVATSATLIGVGFSRRKKHQRGELGISPVLGPTMAGGRIVVRF